MLFLIRIMRKLGIKSTVTKDEIIDVQNKLINGYQDQLSDAESILKALAYGYQSRNRYNELIGKAQQYMIQYYDENITEIR